MKYIILSFLVVFALNGADRSACSEDQIARMIVNNISDSSINKACKPKVAKESPKDTTTTTNNLLKK
jgi:hypothetical protein